MTGRSHGRDWFWQVLSGLMVMVLLTVHTFNWARVDGVSLGLLAAFVLVPHVQRLTKIKWGSAEAELSEHESKLRVDAAYESVHRAAEAKGLPLTPSENVSKVLERYSDPGASITSCKRALEIGLQSYAQVVGVEIDEHASSSSNSLSLFLRNKLDLPIKRSIEVLEPVLDACARPGGQGSWPLAQRIRETVDALTALLEIEGYARSGRFEDTEDTAT